MEIGRFKLGFVFTLQLFFKKKVYLNNNKINFQFFNGVLSEEFSNLKPEVLVHFDATVIVNRSQTWSAGRPEKKKGQMLQDPGSN